MKVKPVDFFSCCDGLIETNSDVMKRDNTCRDDYCDPIFIVIIVGHDNEYIEMHFNHSLKLVDV